jgi:hypothetical protein
MAVSRCSIGRCKRVAENRFEAGQKGVKKLNCLYEGANLPVLYYRSKTQEKGII